MNKNKSSYGKKRIPYNTDSIAIKKKFLIMCEGKKTEPNYFEGFVVDDNTRRVDIIGYGGNTDSLVEAAIKEKKERGYDDEQDQVWCVFDRDSFPAQNFNRAIQLAENNNIKVAYSNEAFELWYLLHYHYYHTGISRKDYCKRLTDLMGQEYKKNDPKIYGLLQKIQDTAIRNAEKLLNQYTPRKPDQDNPSTTVHLLVKALNQFVQELKSTKWFKR